MNFRSRMTVMVVATLAITASGCSFLTQQVVLEGAVAQVVGNRVQVVAATPIKGEAGLEVTLYQVVEQPSVDPTDPPWHLVKPVATGKVAEVTPQGAWVTIEFGVVEPHGAIQLRRERH